MSVHSERKKEMARLWEEIVGIVGPAKQWPKIIRTLFWTGDLNHSQRKKISIFCYVNRLPTRLFFRWATLTGMA